FFFDLFLLPLRVSVTLSPFIKLDIPMAGRYLCARTIEGFLVSLINILVEAGEYDLLHRLFVGKKADRFSDRNFARFFDWVTVNAAANGWKSDCLNTVSSGKREARTITGSQQPRLALHTAIPYGADGVNHVFRRKVVASSDLGFACLATAKLSALLKKAGACGSVYRAVNPAAAEQRAIRRVDY